MNKQPGAAAEQGGHATGQPQVQPQEDKASGAEDFDALAGKKPEDLTPEELRLMADTMPGEGPGD
ncbi:hypothetical protein [Massilia litorea]|uniref:Uncharacterized protein n=1 Tax=Massilia litorea TaxID=2769491 RepID=A0A7L9U773_9BURK|nr:hypothetical protein [Massilia litorea]QOL50112.1 hypothetical protein LPB04_01940 [Massilia litorea]